jgi:hypothetical protein
MAVRRHRRSGGWPDLDDMGYWDESDGEAATQSHLHLLFRGLRRARITLCLGIWLSVNSLEPRSCTRGERQFGNE